MNLEHPIDKIGKCDQLVFGLLSHVCNLLETLLRVANEFLLECLLLARG